VLPAVVRLLKPGGDLLMLVKPQFELQPGQIGKGGIVRDAAHFEFVEKRLRDACAALGLEVKAWLESPIEGGDGNREFFIQAVKGHDVAGEDQPLPAAPQRKVAKRVPRSETARRPRTARRLRTCACRPAWPCARQAAREEKRQRRYRRITTSEICDEPAHQL
jgi:hypothetical protein